MEKEKLFTSLKWAFLALYTFFAYHLLFVPLLLEFSFIGAVIGWCSLLLVAFIIPKKDRKTIVMFIVLTILASTALHHAGPLVSFKRVFQYAAIFLVVYFVGSYYGRFSRIATVTLLVIVFAIQLIVPRDELRLYNHFVKKWESPKLYTGETIDYFPLYVQDIDGDGQEEIITFGNAEEEWETYLERKEKGLDPERMPYDIADERLFLYVYKWNGSEMVRVDNETLDVEKLRATIPMDYIGFPYYYWDEQFTLKPQIQKQTLAEKTGQLGMSPFAGFQLDLLTLNEYLLDFDGVYSVKNNFRFETDVEEISIENGQLIFKKAGQIHTQPTRATKVVDLIRTEAGLAVLLLSDQLELWQWNEASNELILTNTLTETQIEDVMSSEYLIADIQFDGVDEILISSSTSRIVRPKTNGEWDILFVSKDASLRFEDFATIGAEKDPLIVSLSKSRLSRDPLRYLTGFTYTEKGLTQDWKTFVSLINVRSADVRGDGKNQLVATIWKSHQVFIFEKHHLPVYSLLILIFISLVSYAGYRRVRAHV